MKRSSDVVKLPEIGSCACLGVCGESTQQLSDRSAVGVGTETAAVGLNLSLNLERLGDEVSCALITLGLPV